DDIIAPEMIEILYKNIIKTNADMSCCSFFKFYAENHISFNANENYSVLISGNRRYYEVLTGVFLGGFIWNKLYRKSVVLHSNIKFENDIAVSEDALFNAEYIKSSGKICFTDSVLYGYRMHSKSVLHQKFNLKKLTDITAKEKIYDLAESEVDSDLIISNIWEALMKSYVHAYKSLFLKNKAEEKAWKIKIKKGFYKYRYKNSINSSLNYKDKICLLLLKCFSK
ncbi:MAG: hypothetical protein LIO43_06210, partial [Clostridiales bacterium]|nr:hypothetical protein [Clostridiales bacterium]